MFSQNFISKGKIESLECFLQLRKQLRKLCGIWCLAEAAKHSRNSAVPLVNGVNVTCLK